MHVIQAEPVSVAPRASSRGFVRDGSGRGIGYLRLSLTRNCAMRCTYCRPGFVTNAPEPDAMGVDEIEALVRHLVERHGVHKVRLTGGDPTSRADLLAIVERIAAIGGVEDLAMTTHGLTLARDAQRLRSAGLKRVNVSLDTLDAQRYERLTGVDGLPRVLEGIDAAVEAGLAPVKLNAVVVRGRNEGDLLSLVHYAAERGVGLRFIELMPMGPLAERWRERYVTAAQMRAALEPALGVWERLPQGSESATRYRVTLADKRVTTIGFITPMSCNFCAGCDRLRIAADGSVYPCLMDRPAGNVRPALRPTLDADAFDAVLRRAYTAKRPEHPHDGAAIMTHVGG